MREVWDEGSMGCNIHVHTEVKINGKWRHWGTPSIERRYGLFEKMAGVRGEIKNAISPPKGLPEDITFETKFDYDWWGGDMHSASWLSIEEIKKLYEWWMKLNPLTEFIENQFGYCMGNGWDSLPNDDIEDARWVFWFDN